MKYFFPVFGAFILCVSDHSLAPFESLIDAGKYAAVMFCGWVCGYYGDAFLRE